MERSAFASVDARELRHGMEDAMTNYDPRRPTGPVNAGWGGWGGGWIIAVIIVLIIVGFGWGGWYGGWYGGHARVANAPVNTTAPANTTGTAATNATGAHNTNANTTNKP
jgi:hypothetical protein